MCVCVCVCVRLCVSVCVRACKGFRVSCSQPNFVGCGPLSCLRTPAWVAPCQVDWSRVVGHEYEWRVIDTTAPDATFCASASCHTKCSCGSCFGPTEAECQNRCEEKSSRNTYIVVAVVLFCIAFGKKPCLRDCVCMYVYVCVCVSVSVYTLCLIVKFECA